VRSLSQLALAKADPGLPSRPPKAVVDDVSCRTAALHATVYDRASVAATHLRRDGHRQVPRHLARTSSLSLSTATKPLVRAFRVHKPLRVKQVESVVIVVDGVTSL